MTYDEYLHDLRDLLYCPVPIAILWADELEPLKTTFLRVTCRIVLQGRELYRQAWFDGRSMRRM